MATSQTNQISPAQEAGRPQPQTTVESSGGPFIRHSQPGRAPIYNLSSLAFGGITTQPLVARPGYFRNFRVTHTVSGGTGTSATYPADSPYNLNSLITLKDAFGTPLIVGPGYEVANLIGLACIGALVVVLGLQLRKRRRNDMGPTFMASPHQRGEEDVPTSRGSWWRRGARDRSGGQPFRGDRL